MRLKNTKKKITFISILLSLTLLGCSQQSLSREIRVREVIDGDTVILTDGRTLRYIGIDALEVRRYTQDSWVYDPQPFGLEAKQFNQRLVEGRPLRLEFDVEKTDRYDRLLGYCFVDGIFVNARLLEEGFAFLHIRSPNAKYADLFSSLQRKAQQEKKGIWEDSSTISSDEAHRYIGQIKCVEGRVLNIHEGQKAIHLNFGKDWKKDFTVAIFKRDLSLFLNKGISPVKDYQNRFIRVTGFIKEYNGPEIIVSHPLAIEILE